jgi:hypothetical protein
MSDCQLCDYAIIEFFRSGRFFLATDLNGGVRDQTAPYEYRRLATISGGGSGVEPNRELMARTFLANWTLDYGLSIFLTFTLFF